MPPVRTGNARLTLLLVRAGSPGHHPGIGRPATRARAPIRLKAVVRELLADNACLRAEVADLRGILVVTVKHRFGRRSDRDKQHRREFGIDPFAYRRDILPAVFAMGERPSDANLVL